MTFKDPAEQRRYNREYNRKWRAKNKDKTRKYHATFRDKHPERVLKKARHSNWKQDGVDVAAAEAALTAHNNGHCQICGGREPGGRGGWHVDHDHKTGRVRGVLCCSCNRALGYFKDSLALLQAAVRYMKGSNA
jgi:hypothetical protein